MNFMFALHVILGCLNLLSIGGSYYFYANCESRLAANHKAALESLSGSNYEEYRRVELQNSREELLSDERKNIFAKFRNIYFEKHVEDQKFTKFYRKILFASCLLFFAFMIFSTISLWRSAKALAHAKSHLEESVQLRTKELVESQKKITEQQQILMISSKMSALGEMAGGIAHEINTPLGAISIFCSQLLEAAEERQIDKEFLVSTLKTIESTVVRISRIINGLRFFARDGSKDSLQPMSLHTIIQDALNLSFERLKYKNIRVEVICDQNLHINCRHTEISQVILNLTNNASDAIEKMDDKWIKIIAEEKDGQVFLHVQDSGPGIPEEIRSKLMQPFFTTKELGKGTGLGLSSSKGIIESHGGTLTIDSSGDHTQFTISLPSLYQQQFKKMS
jgi:C4-dicarboxylate-specific signal transduction histidine kinase